MKPFEIRTLSGAPQTVRGVTLTPQSQAFVLRVPWGGWVYHRPSAVLVTRDGGTERIPIVDPTRIAQLAILGWFVLVMLVMGSQTRRSHKEK